MLNFLLSEYTTDGGLIIGIGLINLFSVLFSQRKGNTIQFQENFLVFVRNVSLPFV